MSDLNLLLSRLDGVRRINDSRYIAKCPAHDDGDPSLSIRELPDSRILIRCFAGCGALDVLESVSLDWQVLMPDDGLYEPVAERREKEARRDLMVEYLLTVQREGGRLSEEDKALVLKRKFSGGDL
jgi:DNA primase